jgi:hypothetical protein
MRVDQINTRQLAFEFDGLIERVFRPAMMREKKLREENKNNEQRLSKHAAPLK